jgi:hypothetical protein
MGTEAAPQDPEPLVYGEVDNGLVFIGIARAEELIATGDWEAVWPAQEMRRLLPADLLSRYGVIEDTLLDGAFVRIPCECEKELVAELEARGWECQRDDGMVLEASGYD